jgi:hypothetical protein
MAYFRGDHYVFDDGEHLCWWTRGRYDAHCAWGERFAGEGSSGVQIPVALIDRFVLMRFAEMVVEGSADVLLQEMVAEGRQAGNAGVIQLLGNLEIIRASIRDLQQRVREATVDDVWGRASN